MSKKSVEEPKIKLLAIKDENNEFIKNLVLDEIQETEIISDIQSYMEEVEAVRQEYGLYEKWESDRNQYDGVVPYKDFPWDACSNLHIHITSMTVDIIQAKAEQQLYSAVPMMPLRPLPNDISNDVRPKEKWLEYQLKNRVNIEESRKLVIRDAINIGTGAERITFNKRIEPLMSIDIYAPEDIDKFMLDYESEKDTAEYDDYLKSLKNGETIKVLSIKESVTEWHPKVEYVQLEKLYINPKILDIRNNRVIAEEIDITYQEIEQFIKNKQFDKSLYKKLIELYPDTYDKKTDYKIIQAIYKYDYNDDGYAEYCQIKYLKNENIMLKATTYPYIHNRPYYVLNYIKKSNKSVYGIGAAERLKDTNQAMNNLWNQTIDSGTFANAPAFKAKKGSTFDPTIKKWGPAVIWWLENTNDVQEFNFSKPQFDMFNLMGKIERYSEYIIGVSSYMTGRETGYDPNAPASKARMLLQESNLRINDYIKQLQSSLIETVRQIDSLYYQYAIIDDDINTKFYDMGKEYFEEVNISLKDLSVPCEYVPAMSDMSTNKALVKQENIQMSQYLLSMPKIVGNPNAVNRILDIVLKDMGGDWEKYKDEITGNTRDKKQAGAVVNGMGQLPGQFQGQPPLGLDTIRQMVNIGNQGGGQ